MEIKFKTQTTTKITLMRMTYNSKNRMSLDSPFLRNLKVKEEMDILIMKVMAQKTMMDQKKTDIKELSPLKDRVSNSKIKTLKI